LKTVISDYGPRRAFIPYHDRTQRFACGVAHRRCGKTLAAINDMIKNASRTDKQNYRAAYVAPFLNQAKDIAWLYLKHYAQPITKDTNETDLFVELLNGARIRLYGADNPDRLRGPYLDDVVLDEFDDMDENVWPEIIRPMLADRRGTATIMGTFKGRKQLWRQYEYARTDPEWFTFLLKASETGYLPQDELQSARKDMTRSQYEREFECSCESEELQRLATLDNLVFEQRQHTIENIYAIYDPARTTEEGSCATGHVICSWSKNKILVWEAGADFWKPSQIIDDIFRTNERWAPAFIGIEKTGLNQFIEEPLRAAQIERGLVIPLRFLDAPRDRGKTSFILGLEPFFNAKEIVLCGRSEDFGPIVKQILNFPEGPNDIVNALAYMLTFSVGRPVYPEFASYHIRNRVSDSKDFWLVINSQDNVIAGALIQPHGYGINIVKDWVFEGATGEALSEILVNANMYGTLHVIMPDTKDNDHIARALDLSSIKRLKAGEKSKGQSELRRLIHLSSIERPMFSVHHDAKWTIRALAGAYAIEPGRDAPPRTPYRVLMDGLETALDRPQQNLQTQLDGVTWATTRDGQRFITTEVPKRK
jgi:hypothetical protein